jgi:phosphopantothenoylcysteine decarboxylase/phosphopantothenate--cysteine ligase
MHTAMWENAATQANVKTLQERCVGIVGPAVGRLASGGHGAGRFAPVPEILGEVLALLGRGGDLAGRVIVVTAGGTREPIDPVRFLGNRSSGKMGFALAEAVRDRGAEVTLIVGATELEPPAGVNAVRAETAADMLDAVREACDAADALIMAAAVADYAPTAPAPEKLKKGDDDITLKLGRTSDVLATVKGPAIRVGFAAETENLIENARRKLADKRLDLIVANRVGGPDSPFGSDENEATLVDSSGEYALPRMPKRELADRILDRIAPLFEQG